MSNQEDDRFVREVSEELRRERMQNLWSRFGPLVIGAAVAVVLMTAGYQGRSIYTKKQAAQNGDQFNAARDLLDEGKTEDGLAALDAIAKDGTPAYSALARLRAGNQQASDGNGDAALELFNAVATDGGAPDFLRDFAVLRAGQVMVDSASLDAVEAKLQSVAGDDHAFRFAAREAIGLAAYKAGNISDAKAQFEELVADPQAPGSLTQRGNVMLDVSTSSGQ